MYSSYSNGTKRKTGCRSAAQHVQQIVDVSRLRCFQRGSVTLMTDALISSRLAVHAFIAVARAITMAAAKLVMITACACNKIHR